MKRETGTVSRMSVRSRINECLFCVIERLPKLGVLGFAAGACHNLELSFPLAEQALAWDRGKGGQSSWAWFLFTLGSDKYPL
jgi:hypothetical protein